MLVTGWAIDDVEVARVMICRGATAGEKRRARMPIAAVPRISYLGDAVFIEGARPDIQAAFPHVPRNSRGGWGFMVLTNMLPGGGNGVYTFHVYAIDREGRSSFLGTRTITMANATSLRPFGAIDTPAQGGTAVGIELHQLWLGADADAEDDSDRWFDDHRVDRRRERRPGDVQQRATGHRRPVPGAEQ